MKQLAAAATAIVLVRQAIATLHWWGHLRAGVGLEVWQQVFVYVVITAAPLLAIALYWTRWRQAAALLLGLSMLAGMLFGVYFHFIADTPDHVSHVTGVDGSSLFVSTAILLVPIELVGTAFGFWSWARLRRLARG